jgi:cytoskeletal protein RodZ
MQFEPDFAKRLRNAREARELSVEEAAHATRMRPAQIQALESGTLSKFPNAAYAKSFLIMYARYLAVDVSDIANRIDTTTQVGVDDFQYLSSRAEDDKELQRAAAGTPQELVGVKTESRSWLPLVAIGGAAAIAGIGFMVWTNLNRISDQVQNPETAAAKPAVEGPVAQPIDPKPTTPPPVPAPAPVVAQAPAPATNPPTPAPSAPAPQLLPPRPNVVATPPGTAPAAAGVDRSTPTPDIPRARPISPVAKIAADDSALLAEVPVPARATNPANPVPPTAPAPSAPSAQTPPISEVSVNRDDADFVFLEPRKKTWVVIRSGPGGQPLYEDFLYPNARPMRLPPGKYFIELKEADAVAIVRNGKRISYMAPGVLVQ